MGGAECRNRPGLATRIRMTDQSELGPESELHSAHITHIPNPGRYGLGYLDELATASCRARRLLLAARFGAGGGAAFWALTCTGEPSHTGRLGRTITHTASSPHAHR
jgi:hypothetical protein